MAALAAALGRPSGAPPSTFPSSNAVAAFAPSPTAAPHPGGPADSAAAATSAAPLSSGPQYALTSAVLALQSRTAVSAAQLAQQRAQTRAELAQRAQRQASADRAQRRAIARALCLPAPGSAQPGAAAADKHVRRLQRAVREAGGRAAGRSGPIAFAAPDAQTEISAAQSAGLDDFGAGDFDATAGATSAFNQLAHSASAPVLLSTPSRGRLSVGATASSREEPKSPRAEPQSRTLISSPAGQSCSRDAATVAATGNHRPAPSESAAVSPLSRPRSSATPALQSEQSQQPSPSRPRSSRPPTAARSEPLADCDAPLDGWSSARGADFSTDSTATAATDPSAVAPRSASSAAGRVRSGNLGGGGRSRVASAAAHQPEEKSAAAAGPDSDCAAAASPDNPRSAGPSLQLRQAAVRQRAAAIQSASSAALADFDLRQQLAPSLATAFRVAKPTTAATTAVQSQPD